MPIFLVCVTHPFQNIYEVRVQKVLILGLFIVLSNLWIKRGKYAKVKPISSKT